MISTVSWTSADAESELAVSLCGSPTVSALRDWNQPLTTVCVYTSSPI